MISIVTPVWQNHEVIERMTFEMLDSVYKETLGEWELILVIHGGENFKHYIDFPRVTTIYSPERLGIAEAYNKGFAQAQGDVFCCLHNDVLLPWAWNVLLNDVALEGNIGFPMVYEKHGQCEIRGVAPTKEWQTPACCFTLSRELWDRLGGYDEAFKGMHGEDIDLFRRAEQAAARLVRVDTEVVHHRGMTRCLTSDGGAEDLLRNWNVFYYKHAKEPGQQIPLPRVSEKPEYFLTTGGSEDVH